MLLDNVLIAAIPHPTRARRRWREGKGGAREKRDLIKLAIKMPVGRAQALLAAPFVQSFRFTVERQQTYVVQTGWVATFNPPVENERA